MTPTTITRFVGTGALVLAVAVFLWRMWRWALREGRSGHPIAGLTLPAVAIVTLLVVSAAGLVLVFLVPWHHMAW